MPFDSTTGGASANSYVSVEDADAFHSESRLHNTAWSSATTPTKQAALVWATMLLDTRYNWKGVRSDELQALKWPRFSAYDSDGYLVGYNYQTQQYGIPIRLKQAVSELAFRLIEQDRTNDFDGLQEMKIDVLAFKFNSEQSKVEAIPDSVVAMLRELGEDHATVSRSSVVQLVRV